MEVFGLSSQCVAWVKRKKWGREFYRANQECFAEC